MSTRALALSLRAEERQEIAQVYTANALWSILAALYSMAGQTLKMPTLGILWEAEETGLTIEEVKLKREEKEKEFVCDSVRNLIEMFTKKDDSE